MRQTERDSSQGKFFIRPLHCECMGTDHCELCQAIERLGGVKIEGDFAFTSEHQRTVAADLLGEKFGTRYFELS